MNHNNKKSWLSRLGNSLKNQSVKRRLSLGFGLLTLLLVVSGFVSLWQIDHIDHALVQIVHVEEPLEQAVLEMEIHAGESARAILHHIYEPQQKFREQAQAAEQKFNDYYQQYEAIVENEEEQRLGQQVLRTYTEFKVLGDELMDISSSRETNLLELRTDVTRIDLSLDSLVKNLTSQESPTQMQKTVAALRMQVEIEKAFAVVEAYVAMHLVEMKTDLEIAITQFQKQSQSYRSTNLSKSERQTFELLESWFASSVAEAHNVILLTDQLHQLSQRFEADLEQMDRVLDDVIQPIIHGETLRAAQEAMSSSRTAILMLATMGAIGVLFGGFVGWHISRGITQPVTQLVHSSKIIASGDREHRIEIGSQDEFGDLASAFNSMVDKLNRSTEELLEIQKETERLKLLAAQQEIEQQAAAARTDQLTQLPNRRAFDDLMVYHAEECRLSQSKTVALILFDVDKFKKFNDDYGHLAGDAVLQGVTRALATVFQAPDFAARFGGEEFAAILPDCTLAEAAQKAELARQAIEQAKFEFDGQSLRVTASGGVALLSKDTDIETIIRQSDEALYAAKAAGRNNIHICEGSEIKSFAASLEKLVLQ